MKAFVFPSSTVDVNYVVLEDGTFAGAFNETIPTDVTDEHEVVMLTVEEAAEHEGLAEALRLNKLMTSPTPVIYVFSTDPKGGAGPCFAMAESGYVLGGQQCTNEKRAKWDLGIKAPCPHTPQYEAHYPDGYVLEFVPHDKINTHVGLTQARLKNMMLADVKGSTN